MERRSAAGRNRSLPGRRRWRAAAALVLGVALAAGTPLAAVAVKPAPSPGAPGVGDDYFPLAGNGGYDVRHYGLDIDYDPSTDVLDGLAVITAKATQSLIPFNLDLDGLTVESVRVNGRSGGVDRAGRRAHDHARSPILPRPAFITTVRYSGVPEAIDDVLGRIRVPAHRRRRPRRRSAATWRRLVPRERPPERQGPLLGAVTVPRDSRRSSNGRCSGTRTPATGRRGSGNR